jgi:regulator of nonsense transcripts 2
LPCSPDFEPSSDLDIVIGIIMTLPWRENEDFIFRQLLMLVGNAKFDDMPSVAVLVATIQERHRNFVVRLIDHVFEQVLRGIEENDFKDAQRRVSIMKFIGECYNFKIIHTDDLFSMLYTIINWDLKGNCEIPHVAQYDTDSNCFRIRLVCTLLDSLGKFFMARKRRLLLDRFFVFF